MGPGSKGLKNCSAIQAVPMRAKAIHTPLPNSSTRVNIVAKLSSSTKVSPSSRLVRFVIVDGSGFAEA